MKEQKVVSSIGFGIVGHWTTTVFDGEAVVGETIVVNYHNLEKLHIRVNKCVRDRPISGGVYEGTLMKHEIKDDKGEWN